MTLLTLITTHSGLKLYEIDAQSTGSFARPLARLLALLTHLLAPHCSLALLFAPELMGQWNITIQFSRCCESLCTHDFIPTVAADLMVGLSLSFRHSFRLSMEDDRKSDRQIRSEAEEEFQALLLSRKKKRRDDV